MKRRDELIEQAKTGHGTSGRIRVAAMKFQGTGSIMGKAGNSTLLFSSAMEFLKHEFNSR